MILADKIVRLRKKNGWSQEELAEKMNVSRQAVSKWESSQNIPDLEKILQLGNLFDVTTDYLLKDEIEVEEYSYSVSQQSVKRITLEEANVYLAHRKVASHQIAFATLLCILSPITLILLGAASGVSELGISETVMGVVGLCALFVFVLAAVPIYISCGFKNEPYAFLEKDVPFELAYGVKEIVHEHKKKFRSTYIKGNILATCLCTVAPVPLIASAFTENEMLCAAMVAVLMVLVGISVFIFIVVGVQQASMEKLLKEGEYAREQKERSALQETVGAIYWSVLTAIYFGWSFLANAWHISWIVFVMGGILSPAVTHICNLISHKQK